MKFSDFLASWRAFVVCERFPTRGRKSELRKQRNLPLRRQIPDLCHSDVINTHPDTQIPGSSYINANVLMVSHLTRFGWILLSSFQRKKDSTRISAARWSQFAGTPVFLLRFPAIISV